MEGYHHITISMFCQVMPLFGDMKMKPFDTYVKNSVHFNANKWPLSNSTTTSNQVDTYGKRHSA